MRRLIFICLMFIFLFSCNKDVNKNNTSAFINTIELKVGECTASLDNSIICFDSVLNDSRCPIGATCIWEGNAVIKVDLTKNGKKYGIILNTIPSFQTDTTIDNLNISLMELNPYPDLKIVSQLNDYKAKLTIVDLNKIKSNAKVLNFSTDKCMCCWGWTIKIGNDTIMSLDDIIGQKIGYDISNPIDVYVELGAIEKTCSNNGSRNYYKMNQIIKIK